MNRIPDRNCFRCGIEFNDNDRNEIFIDVEISNNTMLYSFCQECDEQFSCPQCMIEATDPCIVIQNDEHVCWQEYLNGDPLELLCDRMIMLQYNVH